MNSKKFDRQAALSKTLVQERKAVQDRFAAAEAVVSARPAGLANPALAPSAFSAESGSLGLTCRLGLLVSWPGGCS